MIQVELYMKDLVYALKKQFADRLLYVGLQGSYLRNEATASSDLDAIVIVDGLSSKDLATYRTIINTLPSPEKSCGFICGKQEMEHWNPLEICNFVFGTKDYYGKITDFVPPFTKNDIKNFIKLSVGNLYHELCHRYVHADDAKNKSKLPGTYKGVFFILQSLYYLKDGCFYSSKKEILDHLEADDKKVLEMANHLHAAADYDFESAFSLLFCWCQRILNEVNT